MIELSGVSKVVPSGDAELTILDSVTLSIPAGQLVAVVGPSGSGKSTLLGLVAGLDRPSAGTVAIGGHDLSRLTEDEIALVRRREMGIVFQSFHLIPTLTARENVQVPMELAGVADPAGRADALLERVGLGKRGHHYPVQLSGGEQQRVAIARAFAVEPKLVLCDEPTGNLDSRTGAMVMELLLGLNREKGATLVLVTHNLELCRHADRVLAIADGRIASDTPGGAHA
jgi:putative ABC transport system ATP-binding protein